VWAGAVAAHGQEQDKSDSTEKDRQEIQVLRQKLEELDQRVRVAERLKENKQEEDAAKAKTAPTVTASAADGFNIRSADGNFTLRVGGYLQADGRFYPNDEVATNDNFLLRRVRLDIRGTVFKYVDYRILPDFGQGTTTLFDAYLELKYFPRAALRAGKFKPGVGLERLQSATDIWFVERGFPTSLVPNRDVGFQLSGDVIKNRLNYSVGAYDGGPDGGNVDTDTNDGKDYTARVFLTPWKPSANHFLSGLGFGIAGSTGNQTRGALPSFKSTGQNTFFSYIAGVATAGDRKRFSPQGYFFYGPFGVLGEYVRSEQQFSLDGDPAVDLSTDAWQVAAAFVLTGEKKSYTGINPKKNFDPRAKTWGAIEVAFRTGEFNVDPAAFANGLADPAKAARRAREWVGGVNWYLNRNLKVVADYAHTSFNGGAATGDRPDEDTVLTRFQIAF
jgi:phosphate-selective porin OprO/OprP